MKERQLALAKELFRDTGVQITTKGHRLLGAPVGTRQFCERYVEDAVASWKQQLETLASVARVQPHAAYAAFTHGFVGKWTFLARTAENTGVLFQPLEDTIRGKLIPLLTGRAAPGDMVRELLALPPRLGGIGLINPAIALQNELERSMQTCAPLADQIRNQESRLGDACQLVASNRATASARRKQFIADAAATLRATLPAPLQRNMDIFSDKGASHWLTVLPVTSHGFSRPKSAFRDALCMRYNWQPDHLPSHCACGQAFSIDHALSCATGGYSVLRHNELRNFTASVMQEVCHDVALEPPLQPLDGELLPSHANVTKEARLDISAQGFWGDCFSRSLFDVRVFHPNAPSAITTSLASQHSKHERSKRRQYEQRVREVQGASFVPLVFSTAGGIGPACSTTFKRLASMLSGKFDCEYAAMLNWLRCRTSFALLRSTIMALRGSRRRLPTPPVQPALALAESRLSHAN